MVGKDPSKIFRSEEQLQLIAQAIRHVEAGEDDKCKQICEANKEDPLFPKFSELKYKKYKLRDNNGEPTVVCCGKTKAKWMVTEQSLLDRIILWYHENGKPNRNGMCEFFLTDYCVDGTAFMKKHKGLIQASQDPRLSSPLARAAAPPATSAPSMTPPPPDATPAPSMTVLPALAGGDADHSSMGLVCTLVEVLQTAEAKIRAVERKEAGERAERSELLVRIAELCKEVRDLLRKLEAEQSEE